MKHLINACTVMGLWAWGANWQRALIAHDTSYIAYFILGLLTALAIMARLTAGELNASRN